MNRKVYKYLTVDDDDYVWAWTTKDLYKCNGVWFPRKRDLSDVGTSISFKLIPAYLYEKARTQIVKIKPVVIVIEEA
jgi:hypothetical protein